MTWNGRWREVVVFHLQNPLGLSAMLVDYELTIFQGPSLIALMIVKEMVPETLVNY